MIAPGDSLFAVFNPTIGTGVQHSLITAFSATRVIFIVRNPATSGKMLFLEYMRLLMTGTAPATTTSMDFAVTIDPGTRVAGLVGNASRTPVLLVPGNSGRSVTLVDAYLGDMTADAATANVRTVGRVRLQTALQLTGDEFVVRFDGDHKPMGPLTGARATALTRFLGTMSPVGIAPGETCLIHRWAPTEITTAPTFEYELAWRERS